MRLRWALIFLLLPLAASHAEDWPQWQGPQRNGQWNEDGILQEFPKGGLKPTWVVPIGSGYSGPVVASGRVIVTHYKPKPESKKLEAIESVLCLDEETGKQLWSESWETHYRRQMFSYATGPRATPLVHQGRVYTVGATGMIHCIDLESGKVVWKRDALDEFGAEVPTFGISAAPLERVLRKQPKQAGKTR